MSFWTRTLLVAGALVAVSLATHAFAVDVEHSGWWRCRVTSTSPRAGTSVCYSSCYFKPRQRRIRIQVDYRPSEWVTVDKVKQIDGDTTYVCTPDVGGASPIYVTPLRKEQP